MLVSTRSLTATTSRLGRALEDRLEGLAADSAEAVDADAGGHAGVPPETATGLSGRRLVAIGWLCCAGKARHHEWLRAGERYIAAERCGHDPARCRARASKASLRDRGADRLEEPVALRLGDGAADHDPVRVERVHVADAADGNGAPRRAP